MITLTIDMHIMEEKNLSINDIINAVKQVRGKHRDIPILINFVKECKLAAPLDQPQEHGVESGSTDANTRIMYGLLVLAIIVIITAIMIYMKKR